MKVSSRDGHQPEASKFLGLIHHQQITYYRKTPNKSHQLLLEHLT